MSSTTVNQEQPNINDAAAQTHQPQPQPQKQIQPQPQPQPQEKQIQPQKKPQPQKKRIKPKKQPRPQPPPATAPASNITPLSLFPPSYAYFENVFTFQTYIVFL
jgi:outer membrane biosynthesis protein TonB